MCITVKHRIDLNKPIQSYIYCIWTNTPRCLGIKVHLQHFSCSVTSPSPGTHSDWKPFPWTSSAQWDGWTWFLLQERPQALDPHTWNRALTVCRPWLEVGFVTRTEILPNWLPVGQHCEETWPNVIVVAHVLVLLLTPDQLCVDVLLGFCPDQVEREWRDLGQVTTEKKKEK